MHTSSVWKASTVFLPTIIRGSVFPSFLFCCNWWWSIWERSKLSEGKWMERKSGRGGGRGGRERGGGRGGEAGGCTTTIHRAVPHKLDQHTHRHTHWLIVYTRTIFRHSSLHTANWKRWEGGDERVNLKKNKRKKGSKETGKHVRKKTRKRRE